MTSVNKVIFFLSHNIYDAYTLFLLRKQQGLVIMVHLQKWPNICSVWEYINEIPPIHRLYV